MVFMPPLPWKWVTDINTGPHMQQDHEPRHGPHGSWGPDVTMASVAVQVTQISVAPVAAWLSVTIMVSSD